MSLADHATYRRRATRTQQHVVLHEEVVVGKPCRRPQEVHKVPRLFAHLKYYVEVKTALLLSCLLLLWSVFGSDPRKKEKITYPRR